MKHRAKSTMTILIIRFQRHQKSACEDKATPKLKNAGKDARTTTLLHSWCLGSFGVLGGCRAVYDLTKKLF